MRLRGAVQSAARAWAGGASHRPPPSSSSSGFQWSSLLLLLPSGVAGYLGYWQLSRRRWKEALLEERAAQIWREPVDLFSQNEELPEYSPVTLRGVYDEDRSFFVGPRGRSTALQQGSGGPSKGETEVNYLLVTPLRECDARGKQMPEGRAVLVTRGWVPLSWKASRPSDSLVRAPQTLRGVLRRSEKGGGWVPANEPAAGNWFSVDATAMARAAELPFAEVPVVDELAPAPEAAEAARPFPLEVLGGAKTMPKRQETYPVPKSTLDMQHFSVMPQDHQNYALVWFTLSAATGLMALKIVARR
ncbi:SURF1 family protein [Helicosporidium sp. ATCC 50920]|nr:SURF1 family protein [Helicosporidium sp. ATCC 50920]|eukprot:KDD72404.1 SURF1 family protein [Helicosporidium sp. ATCC 50920]